MATFEEIGQRISQGLEKGTPLEVIADTLTKAGITPLLGGIDWTPQLVARVAILYENQQRGISRERSKAPGTR